MRLRQQLAGLESAATTAAERESQGRSAAREAIKDAAARAEEFGRAERARSEKLTALVQVRYFRRALCPCPFYRVLSSPTGPVAFRETEVDFDQVDNVFPICRSSGCCGRLFLGSRGGRGVRGCPE